MIPNAAQKVQEETTAHGQAAWAEINRHYQLIHQLISSLPAFRDATTQQVDAAVNARLVTQFRMAETRFRTDFPALSLPPGHPLHRQIFALTWILRTVNPPQQGWPEFQPYYWACCQLEARVEQLNLLREWTRQWEQTLAYAQAHSADIGHRSNDEMVGFS